VTPRTRILPATILGSAIVFLESTIVNVALDTIAAPRMVAARMPVRGLTHESYRPMPSVPTGHFQARMTFVPDTRRYIAASRVVALAKRA